MVRFPNSQLLSSVPLGRASFGRKWSRSLPTGCPWARVATIQNYPVAQGTWKGRVKRIGDWYTQRRPNPLDSGLQLDEKRTLECVISVDVDPDQPPLRIGQRVRVILHR